MDFLTWVYLGLLALFVTVGGNMLSSELYDQCPGLARWLIRLAVTRLDRSQRERYEEEWLAHSAECGGHLGKLLHGLGCVFAARYIPGRTDSDLGQICLHIDKRDQSSVSVDPPTLLFLLEAMSNVKGEDVFPDMLAELRVKVPVNSPPNPETLKVFGDIILKNLDKEPDTDQ